MSQRRIVYRRSDAKPDLTLPWEEETAQGSYSSLDMSTGYTFALTLVGLDGTTALTKSTNITGADGSVTIVWDVGDLDIAAGTYELRLTVTDALSKPRHHEPDEPLLIQIT